MSVSYTHLDVYKRQVLLSICISPISASSSKICCPNKSPQVYPVILLSLIHIYASLLKTGTWKAISTGAGAIVGTATKLTGFDGYPVGMYAGKFQSA